MEDRATVTRSTFKETILLAEDNASLRTLLSIYLESLGYSILQAENGEEVLNLLKKEAPVQLLLTDVIMPPGLRGAELIEEAKRYKPDLKFIFMSGHSKHFLFQEGLLKDVNSPVLTKPFSRADLAALLRETLRKEPV